MFIFGVYYGGSLYYWGVFNILGNYYIFLIFGGGGMLGVFWEYVIFIFGW